MNLRKKYQWKTPLLVKEVILPDKREPEVTESYLKDNPVSINKKHLKNGGEIRKEKTVDSLIKIGDHDVRSIGELLILEKKPLENYFGGNVRKKQVKRKNRCQRAARSLRELNYEELQTDSNGKETPVGSNQFFKEEEPAVKDDKIEREKLLLEIEKFEKMREIMNQKNYIKQRLAEEKYIRQQENLAETWWEIMKRRSQLKKLNFKDPSTHQKSFRRSNSKNRDSFRTSILSREFWSDDEDESSEKPEERKPEKRKDKESGPSLGESELDRLEKTFVEDLVFIDDDVSD